MYSVRDEDEEKTTYTCMYTNYILVLVYTCTCTCNSCLMVFTVYEICTARGLYVLPRAEPEEVHTVRRRYISHAL